MTTNTLKKVVATAATFGLVTSLFLGSAFADTTVVTDGNGANSINNQAVTATDTTVVSQSQQSNISNTISGKVDTGNNNASDNTGGNTVIGTGMATANTNIVNKSNAASASVGDNSGLGGGANTWSQITGNGFGSNNSNAITQNNSQSLFQTQGANFANAVDQNVNSGNNAADANTGGSNAIFTGAVNSNVGLQNFANSAQGSLGGNGSYLGNLQKSIISGNGADSTSNNSQSNTSTALLEQNQNASVSNSIAGAVNSGLNNTSDNTNGNNTIGTGGVFSNVKVGNAANSASASLGGAGSPTIITNTLGNGFGSANNTAETSQNNQSAFQTQGNSFTNALTPDLTSGSNNAADNTGSFYLIGDPNSISTGQAWQNDTVVNEANSATVSDGFSLPGGWSMNFGF